MIGSNRENDETDFDESEEDTSEEEVLDEDAMPDIGGETIIDLSGEIADDLAETVAKVDPAEIAHRREVRRRLEEIAERRNQSLDDTFNFDLDDP
ncbi:MAG TPA: hypothetical protein VLA11_03000 [Woeseiaceae bacterium]|jgi:hypothetical protein|nr:hypothetical protein [Woeseiaceae bacterium]